MPSQLDRLQAALPKRYTLLRELDSGGMSRVYLAREALPDRDVAIKVFDQVLSAQLGRERFVREVEVTSQLGHPHIVPIYAAGEAGGELYYVMPFIGGESLRDRLEREGRLPIEDALQITRQVADALAHAHGKEIVHRDIKPANILFQSGHAVVADFGIARALRAAEDGATLTRTGTSLGTPDYMSPEQISGGVEIGPKTDQYALACVLYEMLGGQPPFHSRTAQATLARHLTDAMPSLRALRDSVPPPMESAVRKALAKAPADRYASVTDFANALPSASGEALPALRGPRERSVGSAGRWWRLAGVAAAVAAVGLAWNAWSGGAPAMAGATYSDSVAIMPFENRTGDPSLDLVGRSLADEVTGHLIQVPQIKVIGQYSALSLWQENLGYQRLLDTLDVGYLIEGFLEIRNGQLQVTVTETNRAGISLDRQTYEVDRFRLDSEQPRIAHQVAEAFVERVGLTSTFDADDDAFGPGHEAYLIGNSWMGRRTPEGIREAARQFRLSVDREPTYAEAHAGLASAYSLAMFYKYDLGFDAYELAARALSSADRAIALDPSFAGGYSARGLTRALLEMDVDSTEADFERALSLAPNESNGAAWYARIHTQRGDLAQAYAAYERARDLDPINPARRIGLASAAFQIGRYDVAIEESRQALQYEPTLTMASAWWGRSLALLGRGAECLRLDLGVYALVEALCLHALGRADEALERVRAAEASLRTGAIPEPDYLAEELVAQELAAYHAYVGDAGASETWLRYAFDVSPFGVDGRLLDSELFAPVRGDAAFADALRRVRTEAQARVRDDWGRLTDDRPRLSPRR